MKKSNWLVIGILILVAIIILAFLYYKNTVGFSPTDEPPYALKWEIRLPQGVISTGHKGATLGDIDNDGDLEAVISLNGVPPELIALDNKGNRLWTITTPGYVVDNPALGDLDGDGDLEIVTASDNYLQARNGQGVLLWSFQTSPYYASIDGGPALADLDNDGRLEIVVGTIQTGMSANHGNTAYVLNYDGSLRLSYKFPAGNLSYQYGIQYANPVIEDLDGDGNFEILVASDEMLYSFDRNGNVDWTYNASKWEPSRISATPAVADFDSDGKKEIVLGSSSKDKWLDLPNTNSSRNLTRLFWTNTSIIMLNNDGVVRWEIPWKGEAISTTPVIADLDNDGRLEIVVGTSKINPDPEDVGRPTPVLSALTKDGKVLWGFIPSGTLQTWVYNGDLAIADTNGDGYLEVLLAAPYPGNAPAGGKLFSINYKGELLWDYDVSAPRPFGPPVVGDIDNDGRLDIVFGTTTYGGGPLPKIIALTQAESVVNEDTNPWPMFAQNLRRTSFYRRV